MKKKKWVIILLLVISIVANILQRRQPLNNNRILITDGYSSAILIGLDYYTKDNELYIGGLRVPSASYITEPYLQVKTNGYESIVSYFREQGKTVKEVSE